VRLARSHATRPPPSKKQATRHETTAAPETSHTRASSGAECEDQDKRESTPNKILVHYPVLEGSRKLSNGNRAASALARRPPRPSTRKHSKTPCRRHLQSARRLPAEPTDTFIHNTKLRWTPPWQTLQSSGARSRSHGCHYARRRASPARLHVSAACKAQEGCRENISTPSKERAHERIRAHAA
jgi:hypothetical protein